MENTIQISHRGIKFDSLRSGQKYDKAVSKKLFYLNLLKDVGPDNNFFMLKHYDGTMKNLDCYQVGKRISKWSIREAELVCDWFHNPEESVPQSSSLSSLIVNRGMDCVHGVSKLANQMLHVRGNWETGVEAIGTMSHIAFCFFLFTTGISLAIGSSFLIDNFMPHEFCKTSPWVCGDVLVFLDFGLVHLVLVTLPSYIYGLILNFMKSDNQVA